jgi:hypothetical protein
LIKLISGKPKEELDLQTLPSDKDGLIIKHYRIRHKIISYFKDWHCIPKTLGPAAGCLATHPLFWRSLLKKQKTTKFLNKDLVFPKTCRKAYEKTVRRRSVL